MAEHQDDAIKMLFSMVEFLLKVSVTGIKPMTDTYHERQALLSMLQEAYRDYLQVVNAHTTNEE